MLPDDNCKVIHVLFNGTFNQNSAEYVGLAFVKELVEVPILGRVDRERRNCVPLLVGFRNYFDTTPHLLNFGRTSIGRASDARQM